MRHAYIVQCFIQKVHIDSAKDYLDFMIMKKTHMIIATCHLPYFQAYRCY